MADSRNAMKQVIEIWARNRATMHDVGGEITLQIPMYPIHDHSTCLHVVEHDDGTFGLTDGGEIAGELSTNGFDPTEASDEMVQRTCEYHGVMRSRTPDEEQCHAIGKLDIENVTAENINNKISDMACAIVQIYSLHFLRDIKFVRWID